MKKNLLLVAALIAALSLTAQDKVWNFTNLSSTTTANLEAEAAKTSGANFVKSTSGDYTRFTSTAALLQNFTSVKANNVDVEELSGLIFGRYNTAYAKLDPVSTGLRIDFNNTDASDRIGLNGSRYAIAIPVSVGDYVTIYAASATLGEVRGWQIQEKGGAATLQNGFASSSTAEVATFTACYQVTATSVEETDRIPGGCLIVDTTNGLVVYSIVVSSNIPSSVSKTPADFGVTFNGYAINNPHNLNLSVYNVLGKIVTTSNASIIDASGFINGMYIVRAAGVKGALKIYR